MAKQTENILKDSEILNSTESPAEHLFYTNAKHDILEMFLKKIRAANYAIQSL